MAARDNENRLRFLGYNLVSIKVLVFALSAAIAAIAGAVVTATEPAMDGSERADISA